MKQYELFELSFTAPAPAGNQVAVDLTAVFAVDGAGVRVRGFYDGDDTWRVRFYPTVAGEYRWMVSGAVNASGVEVCEPNENPKSGIVRAEGTSFRQDGGAWFYPVGTTIYAMVHQPEALVDQTMETLSQNPFNKVRMCVFPKHYDFNNNEPELFAFERGEDGKFDFTRPCFAYWKMLERRLAQLDTMGIQSDLILFHPYDHWGFAQMKLEECLSYLDYLTRRLSAVPNLWWSLANEYDLMDFPRHWWDQFAMFLSEMDPFGHLLSNHNWMIHWDFHNPQTTHCCIQGSEVQKTGKYLDEFNKPVLFDEMCYEGNLVMPWGSISGQELTHRFWTVCAQGGYATHGEVFMHPEDILWWAKGGVLRGESPARIAFLRETLESLPSPLLPSKSGFDPSTLTPDHPMVKDNPILQRILALPKEQIQALAADGRGCKAQSADGAAQLNYLGRRTPYQATLSLGEGEFSVWVLDTWNMTKTLVFENAEGRVEVPLPGKDYMAILAIRN